MNILFAKCKPFCLITLVANRTKYHSILLNCLFRCILLIHDVSMTFNCISIYTILSAKYANIVKLFMIEQDPFSTFVTWSTVLCLKILATECFGSKWNKVASKYEWEIFLWAIAIIFVINVLSLCVLSLLVRGDFNFEDFLMLNKIHVDYQTRGC